MHLNKTHCLFTLLFFNSLFACLYYAYTQDQSTSKTRITNIFKSFRKSWSGNGSIDLVRNVLASEYKHSDLQTFYELVKTEFALGLRCTRNAHTATTTTTVSSVTNENRTNGSLAGEKRSTAVTIQSRPHPRQRQSLRVFYSFAIENLSACSAEPLDLLIIVISKCGNFKTRDAIRRTWGSRSTLATYPSISARLLFLLDVDEKLDRSVRLENELFHDIIQVELPQQYTLVTHRELSLWEWSFRFCRTAKYLFKTDDDIFINIVALLKFVSPLLELPSDKSFRTADMSLYGYKHFTPNVFRTANNSVETRYVVTKDEYPCDLYPNFLSGFGYLIPKKTRDAILYASFLDPNEPFRLSDVYVSAILPEYLSLARISMADYSIRYEGSCDEFFTAANSFACAGDSHYGNTSDVFYSYYRYWTQVNKFL